MRALPFVLIASGIATWVLSLSIAASHFEQNRPSQPDPTRGMTIEFNNHGSIHYISKRDSLTYQGAGAAGLLIAAIGGWLFERSRKQNRA